VIALVETERSQGHCHSDVPALAGFIERGPQFLDKVEEVVLVAEGSASVGSGRIFPIEIKAVEAVPIHESYKITDFLQLVPASFATLIGSLVLRKIYHPALDNLRGLEYRSLFVLRSYSPTMLLMSESRLAFTPTIALYFLPPSPHPPMAI